MKIEKLVREPLVHFLALGALLFALHGAVKGSRESVQDNRIVISDAKVEWLQGAWSKQWRRMPTRPELNNLIDGYIREEILYREALAIGLDGNDTIIRRRLAMKMEFLAKDVGQMIEPTDEEVSAFFASNTEQYAEPPRISFRHVYFNADTRTNAERDARSVLRGFKTREPSQEEARQQGDPFMLHYVYSQRSRVEVVQLFGESFADRIFALKPGNWNGPLTSGYGIHLVRVDEQVEGRLPDLEDVSSKVHDDLMEHRRKQSYDAYYESLRQKYDVRITASALNELKAGL